MASFLLHVVTLTVTMKMMILITVTNGRGNTVRCWLRGIVVERWSLTSELPLSCARRRPAADG